MTSISVTRSRTQLPQETSLKRQPCQRYTSWAFSIIPWAVSCIYATASYICPRKNSPRTRKPSPIDYMDQLLKRRNLTIQDAQSCYNRVCVGYLGNRKKLDNDPNINLFWEKLIAIQAKANLPPVARAIQTLNRLLQKDVSPSDAKTKLVGIVSDINKLKNIKNDPLYALLTEKISAVRKKADAPAAKPGIMPTISSLFKRTSLADQLNFQYHPGRHTVKSPVVATRAGELIAVKKAIRSEAVLAKLQDAIYKSEFIYLIPTSKKDQADAIAREIFLKYISKYASHGCTEKNIVDWTYSGMPGCASNKTHIYDLENAWNTWCVHVIVEGRHGKHNEEYGRYLPPHVVAYHEIMHAEETLLRARKIIDKENGIELLTTTKTIILVDTIYKKIHGISEAKEVDYNKFIVLNGRKIKLGRFANFYREQETKLGKLYLALISPRSIQFLTGKIQ